MGFILQPRYTVIFGNLLQPKISFVQLLPWPTLPINSLIQVEIIQTQDKILILPLTTCSSLVWWQAEPTSKIINPLPDNIDLEIASLDSFISYPPVSPSNTLERSTWLHFQYRQNPSHWNVLHSNQCQNNLSPKQFNRFDINHCWMTCEVWCIDLFNNQRLICCTRHSWLKDYCSFEKTNIFWRICGQS